MSVFLRSNSAIFFPLLRRSISKAIPVKYRYQHSLSSDNMTSWKRKSVSSILISAHLSSYMGKYLWFLGLVRFVPKSDSSKVLIGQPTDESIDVGVAVKEGKEVGVDVFSGSSVLSPGQSSGQNAVIDRILSPLTQNEVGTIRCIGLNVSSQRQQNPLGMDIC